MNRSTPLALLLAFGCAEEISEPDLLLPTAVSVEWDAAWNGADDGLGALVPVDVMVYDGATGEPVEGVEVLVSAADPGVLPVPVEGVLVVEDQTDPDALWDASRDQYIALWTAPYVGDDDNDLLSIVSDDDLEDGFIDELVLETDDGGIARLYLYVDAFPRSSQRDSRSSGRHRAVLEFLAMPVVVTMSTPTALAERTFDLVPR